MFKWAEVAIDSQKARFENLSRILKKEGIDNDLKFHTTSFESLSEALPEILSTSDQIVLDMNLGKSLSELLPDLSVDHYFTAASDALVKSHGRWFPKCFLQKSFIEVLNQSKPNFDIHMQVLVIGCGPLARIVVYTFQSIGYTKFAICDKSEEEARKCIADIKSHAFNLQVQFVSQDELAYLPGSSSLVVNTLSQADEIDLLNDLYYFNYLSKNGLVIDLSYEPLTPPLMAQAKDLGLRIIEGYRFFARADFNWVNEVLNKDLNWEVFEKDWLEGIAGSS